MASDGHWAIFNQQRRDFDPVEAPLKSDNFRLRTVNPIKKLVRKIPLRPETNAFLCNAPPQPDSSLDTHSFLFYGKLSLNLSVVFLDNNT
jgi:hypothetical protein